MCSVATGALSWQGVCQRSVGFARNAQRLVVLNCHFGWLRGVQELFETEERWVAEARTSQWSGTGGSGSNPNIIRLGLRYFAATMLRYSCSNSTVTLPRTTPDAGNAKHGTSTSSPTTWRRFTRNTQRSRRYGSHVRSASR